MDTKNIFLELISEAQNAKVNINHEEYSIGFNTTINGKSIYFNNQNNIELIIEDLDYFISLLDEYINIEKEIGRKEIKYINNERDYKKFLIMYLFTNATTEDFINIEQYIKRVISFVKDNTLSSYNNGITTSIGGLFEDDNLTIKNTKQTVMMETPYKIEFTISDKNNPNLVFHLPEISYGIRENNGKKECFIYSILNREDISKTEDEKLIKYKKTISRKLYKLNKDISLLESEEYIDYKNGNSEYYPENISDVSMSSVLSLYLFINLIKDKVSIIKGVPYLPIRYYSRDYASINETNPKKSKQIEERNDQIQSNLTDKFIRTFRRVKEYISGFEIESYPYETDEYITCSLNNELTNVLDNEVTNSFKK